jgi:hypothetical protein
MSLSPLVLQPETGLLYNPRLEMSTDKMLTYREKLKWLEGNPPLCPPQISRGLPWDSVKASVLKSQLLIASLCIPPSSVKNCQYHFHSSDS